MRLPEPGDLFDGQYRVDRVIGEGAFGTVFAAEEVALGRRVALKILKPQGNGYEPDMRARFLRERRALATLRSPSTVMMLNHGESPTGLLYVVFEYLEGRELGRLLAEHGPLSSREIRHVLRQVLGSLVEAHAQGVLHRDLKPENIVVIEQMGDPLRVKVIDFGIARSLDAGSPSVTATGELIGTPRYMSPEQLTGKPLTAASDLYTVGVIAYEMALGRDALAGSSWGAQLDRLTGEQSFRLPDDVVDAATRTVIEKLCERDPAARFQSATAVLQALDADRAPAIVKAPRRKQTPTSPRPGWALAGAAAVVLAVWGAVVVSAPKRVVPVVHSAATKPDKPTVLPKERSASPRPAPVALHVDAGTDEFPSTWSRGCGTLDDGMRGKFPFGREHVVFLPQSYASTTAMPLLVLLHDRAWDKRRLFREEAPVFLAQSGFTQLAESEGFLILAPQGDATPWEPSELASVRDAAATFQELYCVDRSRIYMVGQGVGGDGVDRMWSDSWIRAVATNGHIPNRSFRGLSGTKQWLRPAIHLIPTASRHDSLDGTQCEGDAMRAPWSTIEGEMLQDFACDTAPRIWSPDTRGGRCQRWDCGAPLTHCLVEGGRPWAGTRPREECEGVTPRFPMTTVIWQFFAELPDDAVPRKDGVPVQDWAEPSSQ